MSADSPGPNSADAPSQIDDYADKSSVATIRARFDADVERFSNLETGQSAAVDSPLALDLVTRAAAACTPDARSVLDIGCGAGNYTLKLLQRLPNLDCTLLDLSRPMLDRAAARVGAVTTGRIVTVQEDVRALDLPPASVDIVLASAVLHHLRADAEWDAVFAAIYRWLRPGGSVWIFDLVTASGAAVDAMQRERYGQYLTDFRDAAYRDHVFAYIAAEDTPRPLMYQLDALRRAGFPTVEVLHVNTSFAAFGAIKAR